MICREAQHHMKAYFEDLLTEEEYQEVGAHLEQCAQCRQYAASTGSLSYLLKELGDMDISNDLSETIRFRLEKIIENPKATEPQQNKITLFIARHLKTLGGIAVVLVAAGVFIALGKDKDGIMPPTSGISQAIGVDETATVDVITQPPPIPVNDQEAGHLYKQLQVMATSLEQIAGEPEVKKGESPVQPAAEVSALDPEIVDDPADTRVTGSLVLHWHISYTRDAERSQLVDTVKILEIDIDFEDRDFLVFRASGKQLRLLINGIQFANKSDLDVPEFILEGDLPDRAIPVSIYFIKLTPFTDEVTEIPIVKKEGVFVSLEQKAPESKNVVDWHILTISSQKEKLPEIIRRAGGKVIFESGHAMAFTVHGANIKKLMEDVSGLGGVFADFGKEVLSENALMKEMVKVLIHIKEQ